MRRSLAQELSTYRGFRRRVRIASVQQVAGLAAPIGLLLLAVAVYGTWSILRGSDVNPGGAWDRFVGSSAMWWDAAALLLLVVARVGFVLWIRREHRWLRREGWVAMQGATGWVLTSSDSPTTVVHDHRSLGGQAQYRSRQLGDPIVVASGPQTSAVEFGRALAAVRTSIAARPYDEVALKGFYRQSARWRSIPAGPWFAEATGCLLGQGDDGPFTATIPRPYKDGRRTRLARIRLTKAETDALAHPG